MFFTIKAYAASSGGDHWVTINGTHVLIGDSGKIKKGPDKFIGSTVAEMKKATNTSKSSTSKTTKKTATTKKEATKSGSAKSAKKEDNKSNDTFFDKKNLKSVDKEVKEFAGYYKEMGKTSSDDIDPIDMSTLTGVEINEITGKAYDIDTGRALTTAEANARADYVSQQFDKIFNNDKANKGGGSKSTEPQLSDRAKAIKDRGEKYKNKSISELNSTIETAKKEMAKHERGTPEYKDAQLNVLALLKVRDDKTYSSLTKEQQYQFAGRDVRNSLNKEVADTLNRTKISEPKLPKKSASTSKTATTNSTTGTKYPSGITTPAQKRAYTRAVNSGMSTTDAKKSALGKSTTAKSTTTKTTTKSTAKATTKTSTAPVKKTTSTTKKTTAKASTTKKTATKKAEPKGKYTADNIPQVAGASKSIMKRTANLMNRGVSYDDAFDSALRSAGYGIGTRRGMFR